MEAVVAKRINPTQIPDEAASAQLPIPYNE